ncbi:11114_t:CDS:1, partial [Cetraspora pellucida]
KIKEIFAKYQKEKDAKYTLLEFLEYLETYRLFQASDRDDIFRVYYDEIAEKRNHRNQSRAKMMTDVLEQLKIWCSFQIDINEDIM